MDYQWSWNETFKEAIKQTFRHKIKNRVYKIGHPNPQCLDCMMAIEHVAAKKSLSALVERQLVYVAGGVSGAPGAITSPFTS